MIDEIDCFCSTRFTLNRLLLKKHGVDALFQRTFYSS